MHTKVLAGIAGIMVIGFSITLGQTRIDTIPENQTAEIAGHKAHIESGNTGIHHCHYQDDSLPQKLYPTRKFSFIGIGVYDVNLDDFNSRLNSSGISRFDPAAFNFSFGRHIEIRKLILEGEFSGLAWDRNVDDALRTSLYAANIKGHLGINVLPIDGLFSLAPFAGLGFGLNGLRICNDSKTLSQAIENSDPNVTLWQGTFLTQIGVAADFVFASPDKRNGFAVGIRGGYQFAPLLTSWYSDDVPITDVPDLKQRGVFVKLILGGWQPHRHKHHCHEK